MASDAEVLASFLPDRLVRRLLEEPQAAGQAHCDRLVGALLLADISGFTAITERLAAGGPGGAEELRGLLDGAFSPLLELIAGTGGDVLKFAGDALLACWPAPAVDLDGRGGPGTAGVPRWTGGWPRPRRPPPAAPRPCRRPWDASPRPSGCRWPCGSGSGPARWWCWTSGASASAGSCWSPGRRCRRRPGPPSGPGPARCCWPGRPSTWSSAPPGPRRDRPPRRSRTGPGWRRWSRPICPGRCWPRWSPATRSGWPSCARSRWSSPTCPTWTTGPGWTRPTRSCGPSRAPCTATRAASTS